MRTSLLTIILVCGFIMGWSQTTTPQQLPIVSVTPSENTGQDYSPWLSDDLSNEVQSAWSDNLKWTQVTLKLGQKSLISSLSLYDLNDSFADKPALIYAMNGTQRVLIGSFTGEAWGEWITFTPVQPLVADAIMVYKFGNYIPQKIKAFGQPITETTDIPRPLDLLKLVSAKDKPATGHDYSAYLNDDLGNLVASHWHPDNDRWTDVTIKFEKKSLLTKLELFDAEGTFESTPAEVYALNGTEKTLIGTFTGDAYQEFKVYNLAEPRVAEGIVIHKFQNAIPLKIRAYGKVLPEDPLDAILYEQERVKVVSVTPNLPTTQNYAPYTNDDMNSLVQDEWTPENCRWLELTLKLETRSEITKLELFDGQDSWNDTPAEIYALDGTTRTLLGTFTGPDYMKWQELKTSQLLVADAIMIRKYCNALPLKVRVYGHAVDEPITTTPPTSTTAAPVSLGAKIPISASRWYQLNHVSNGLDALFDNNTGAEIHTGYGKVLDTYDAYYPLLPDESMAIKAVKFFDGNDSKPDKPLRLSIITNDWRRIEIAQFQGLDYESWVGPYPNRQPSGDHRFLLDSVITGARYLVINTSDFWPREIELYGTYQAGTPRVSTVPVKSPRFKNLLGINAFEWDFYPPGVSTIAEPKMKALKSFGVIRHYMDWEKIELTEGYYTFNPTRSGGWDYDQMYERCKAEGIEVMTCFKDIAFYLRDTYPADHRNTDNIPVSYGSNPALPQSYVQQARAAFQYAARYGKNTHVDPALVKVDNTPRYSSSPINTVKIGLGLINYIECENERDKWWNGRWAYQTGREYAANMSAFYDGHKNTMGPGVGIKNADPSMVVVMGGLTSLVSGTDYVRGMIDWCKEFRGYKPDGHVDLCWDVINYHLYSDNANSMQSGSSTRGATPELSVATQVARNVVKMAYEACYGMPVYISETGYDLHPGSPLKAIPIGSKSALITQADWNLRTALMYAREGIDRVDFYQTYDLDINSGTQFASMGFINQDFSRKPTADYFYQAKNLIGDYVFKETISTNPNVDRYEHNGQSAYALWIPDEVGRTGQYTLDLGGASAAKIFTLQVGCDTMSVQVSTTVGGQIALTLTETPIFVKGVMVAGRVATQAETTDWQQTLQVFPNPATDNIMVGWTNAYIGKVLIRVLDANLGLTHRTQSVDKTSPVFKTTLDVSTLPYGLHLVEIQQGSERVIRRIMKVR